MKIICPVCKASYEKSTRMCKKCYFQEVNQIFCSEREREKWTKEIVEPYRTHFQYVSELEKKIIQYQTELERLKQDYKLSSVQTQKSVVVKENKQNYMEIPKTNSSDGYQIGAKIMFGNYRGELITCGLWIVKIKKYY